MQASWQTVSAQQYPDSLIPVAQSTYETAVATEHAVYTTTDADPVTIVVPTDERTW